MPRPAAMSLTGHGLMNPVTAFILGWLLLGQSPTAIQALGMLVVVASILASQVAQGTAAARTAALRR